MSPKIQFNVQLNVAQILTCSGDQSSISESKQKAQCAVPDKIASLQKVDE